MPLDSSHFVPKGHLIHQDLLQFVQLLTGIMTDQPVTLANRLTVQTSDTVALRNEGVTELAVVNTPPAPGFGFARVYPKADGCLYILDPSGIERSLCGAQGPPGPTGSGTCDKPLRTYIRNAFSVIDPGGPPDPDDCVDGGGTGPPVTAWRGVGVFADFGPPPDPIPTSLVGDLYIDLLNWDIYRVS